MPHSFAEKLEQLFDVVRRPDGSPFPLSEVVAGVNAEGRAKLSASYLSELRSGRKDNPNVWVADALARFFGQPLEYFVDDDLSPVVPGAGAATSSPGLRETDLSTLAGRLNFLLVATQPSGGHPPDSKQVAQWLAREGYAVSADDINKLRAGMGRPPAGLLNALADHFHVPESFLTSEDVAAALAGDLRLLRVMRDRGLRRLAFRAQALSPGDRERVADLINRLAGDPGLPAEELDF